MEDDHRREVSALQWKLDQSEKREEYLREKAYRHDKIVKALGKEQVERVLESTTHKAYRRDKDIAL